MLRTAFACLLLASPLHAWDFTPVPVCTIEHATDLAAMTVTYDPLQPQPYAISVALSDQAWAGAPVFAIRFDGPNRLTITTNRHELSPSKTVLTVRDTGFDNVLNGLEFNLVATAVAGGVAVPIPLADAAPAVQAFRDCTKGGLT